MAVPSIPNFPFTLPNLFPQQTGTPSPFSSAQQNVLNALANGIINNNPTLITSGFQDLANAEQTLQGQGGSLNSLISGLNQLSGVLSNPTQIALLQSILANPNAALELVVANAIQDTGANGVLQALQKATGAKLISNITVTSPGIISIGARTPTLGGGTLGAGVGATSGIGSGVINAPVTSISFSTQFQGLFDALFGQLPGSNDVFTVLQTLYNFGLANPSLTTLATILNGFTVGNLSGNSLRQPTFFFPSLPGDNLGQFLQALETFTLSPGLVMAEILLTPPSGGQNLSASYNIYNFLSAQPTGAGGPVSQVGPFVGPLFDALVGINPGTYSTTNATDPFNLLYSLVTNPTTFLSGLFSSSALNGGTITPAILIKDLLTTPGNFPVDFAKIFNGGAIGVTSVTPQTLITDLFTNPNQLPADLLSIIKTPFPNFFTGLFPTVAPWAGGPVNPQQLMSDLFSNPLNVPCDILGLVNITNFAGLATNPVSSATSLCNTLSGLFSNIFSIGAGAFTGRGSQPDAIFLLDSVKFAPAGSTGWFSSAAGPLSSVNGKVQGDIGYAAMMSATAINEINLVIGNLTGGSASFNFVATLGSIGADAQRLIAAPLFIAKAVNVLVAKIAELEAALMNIKNVLNNANLPTGPGGSAPGIGNIQTSLLPSL